MYPEQYFILGLCEHLAWPVVVIFCVLLFKKDISDLVGRIKNFCGVEFDSQKVSTMTLEQQNREIELNTLVARKSEVASENNNASETKENEEGVR